MGFNKRFLTTEYLLEKYQNSGFQQTKDWVTKPDALIFMDNKNGASLAGDFYQLVCNGKDKEAELLLITTIKNADI
jgi:hypothetical protein